jgi:hypothetical protein
VAEHEAAEKRQAGYPDQQGNRLATNTLLG